MSARWAKVAVVVLVLVIVAVLPAAAQKKFRFGANDKNGVPAVQREGRPLVQAAPFFRRAGGELTRDKKDYVYRRGGHEWRFRPGDRNYSYDRERRQWSVAPWLYGGSLYLHPQPFFNTWGWNYQSYPDYYCVNCGSQWMGPGQLEILTPQNGVNVRGSRAVLSGQATPYRDLHVALYVRPQNGADSWNFVYDTPLRAQANGFFSTYVNLPRPGRYRAVVQLLNGAGGVEEERRRQFESF